MVCLLRYVENALAFGHLALCVASIHPPNFKVAHQPVLPIAQQLRGASGKVSQFLKERPYSNGHS